MAKIARIALIVAVPVLILFLPLVVYVVDVSANEGTVARNVSVMGIDVSGMTEEEALAAVSTYEQTLRAEPAVFVVNDVSFELGATEAGLVVNTDEMVAEAMVQRQNSLLTGFMPWMKSFNDDIDLPLTVTVDGDIIDEHLATWEEEAVAEPAFEGAIQVVAGSVDFEYPRDGLRMDRETSHDLVEASLLSLENDTVELPVLSIETQLGEAEIDDAVATAEKLIAKPVTLRADAGGEAAAATDDEEGGDTGQVLEFTMQPEHMADAVRIDIVEETPVHVEIDLDEDVVDSYLEPRREDLETRPTQVQIQTNVANNNISVIPGKPGTGVDAAEVAPALYDAALAEKVGELPVGEGEQPRYTEEDIEAWGPLGRVADFTTYHPAGQPRVTNIQLMAKTVDDTIVWPGETFSINAIVGRRTEAKGYKRDGAIINGEVKCCDEPTNVGGGVSQFATTMYNAAFFGCYEDIEHAPHSIYFSRYPEGREATLGWEHPDVKFRNDSQAPVIVRTGYTSGSITVKLFGNNGGRKCKSESSERHNFTEPREFYEVNANVSPGARKLVRSGSEGWSITITRVITMPDGSVIKEPYTHHYQGSARKYYVHSCATAPGSARCSKPPAADLPPPTTEAPATTAAPGTTQAPNTTQAPATTQPPATTKPPPPTTEPPPPTTEPPPPDTTQPPPDTTTPPADEGGG